MTADLTDAEKIELATELLAEVERKSEAMKDGERVRVPMFAMDSVQKAIHDANAVYGCRPGYRFSQKLMKDGDTEREAIIDSYEQYDSDLQNRWRDTPPEPARTPSAPVLDSDFDESEDEDFYAEYDARLQDAWRSK